MRTWTFRISLLLVISLLLSSCLYERQLAERFVREWTRPALLLLPPQAVLRENLKKDVLEGRKGLSEAQERQILFDSSLYLKAISDSVLLESYMNALISELRLQGYIVYTDQELDSFLRYQGEAYILDVAQFLVEEYTIPYEAREMFDDTIIYFKHFDLNAVSLNSWFELTQVNTETEMRRAYYASHYVVDELQGRFFRNPLKGNVVFKYKRYPMELEDVYQLAALLGHKYAGWLTDQFLNGYIEEALPEGLEPEAWIRYERASGRFVRDGEERFMRIEPQ